MLKLLILARSRARRDHRRPHDRSCSRGSQLFCQTLFVAGDPFPFVAVAVAVANFFFFFCLLQAIHFRLLRSRSRQFRSRSRRSRLQSEFVCCRRSISVHWKWRSQSEFVCCIQTLSVLRGGRGHSGDLNSVYGLMAYGLLRWIHYWTYQMYTLFKSPLSFFCDCNRDRIGGHDGRGLANICRNRHAQNKS